MTRTALLERTAHLLSSLTEAPSVVVWSDDEFVCLGAKRAELPIEALRSAEPVEGWQTFGLISEKGSGGSEQEIASLEKAGMAILSDTDLSPETHRALEQVSSIVATALATERDLRELHRAELLESRSLTDGLQAIVVITNSEGSVLDVNRSGLATLPDDRESPIGMRLEDTAWFDHDPIIRHDLRQALDFCTSGEAVRYDTTLRLDQSLVAMDLSLMPLSDRNHSVTHIVCSATDITVRKQIEEHLLESQAELRQSLSEKETLLREVHHRVKNNLQVISSLLGLQARRLSHEGARGVLDESRERVRAMSMVHEKLYQARDISELNAGEYLSSLVSSLRSAYASSAENIDVEVDCDPITLGVDQAIPLGLIVNELVSNAFKHAFEGRSRGLLQVRLQQDGRNGGTESEQGQRLTLLVADDGVGFEGEIDLTPRETLGLRLIAMLTEQLNGTLTIERKGGTSFGLEFLR